MISFGKADQDRYIMPSEVEEAVRAAIFQAIKDALPEEARRVDVLLYLLGEAKNWVKAQRINL